jgi:hypothetical protein
MRKIHLLRGVPEPIHRFKVGRFHVQASFLHLLFDVPEAAGKLCVGTVQRGGRVDF